MPRFCSADLSPPTLHYANGAGRCLTTPYPVPRVWAITCLGSYSRVYYRAYVRRNHEQYSTEAGAAELSLPSDEERNRPIRSARTRRGERLNQIPRTTPRGGQSRFSPNSSRDRPGRLG